MNVRMLSIGFMMNDITSDSLIELALDLANSLVNKDRFSRLISHVRQVIPCEAVVLLQFEDNCLKPLALHGLTRDTLGRQFHIEDHPRFKLLCGSRSPMRFDSDSELPDPFDGLLNSREGDLLVHACMGLPLYSDDQQIGLLTLDSLTPDSFNDIAQRTLDIVSAMSAATLKTAMTLNFMEHQVIHNQEIVAGLSHEVLCRNGGELIGESPLMKQLNNELQVVADSELSILITGETGVGKELVARSLHQQSARAKEPLVYVNCAALPENLIESELFGHVKGAFTGADKKRAGKFSLADCGTLFLDEIGELPLATQSKFLRVLQNKEIQPVGQDKVEAVNVRVIAATNRDLESEVAKGRFRADLYHRLSVYPISVPPLRDRVGDVVLLAGYFIELTRRKLGVNQLKIDAEAMSYLNQYDWPGNVRELEHIISRGALKARASQKNRAVVSIGIEHCGELTSVARDFPVPEARKITGCGLEQTKGLKVQTENYQRQLIREALSAEGDNWAAAARRLKTDRANLIRLSKRLGIEVVKSVVVGKS